MSKKLYVVLVLSCLVLLAACSRLSETSSPEASTESPAETRPMPGYVPVALRGDLQTASTEGVDAYYDKRTRTFSNGYTLTYWVADNLVLEGDIILYEDAEEFEALLDEYERRLQEGTLESQAIFADPYCRPGTICNGSSFTNVYDGRRWSDDKVYYDVQSILNNFNRSQEDKIFAAMTHIQNKTNGAIQFIEVKAKDRSKYPNRIEFKREGGCSSRLGMVGGVQTLRLGGTCANYLGVVIHELGHALGMRHEHQRCDRDNYIVPNNNNLKEKGLSAFAKKCEHSSTHLSFDYLSIMMYPYKTRDSRFVKDTNSPMFTIKPGRTLPINPKTEKRLTLGEIGNLDFLSPKDIDALKERYARWPYN